MPPCHVPNLVGELDTFYRPTINDVERRIGLFTASVNSAIPQ